MSIRASIQIISFAFLLGGIFLWATTGRTALPMAMVFIMSSVLGSTVATAIQQMEARLKALEERLARCERIPASAP
jgi:hypothetical protein